MRLACGALVMIVVLLALGALLIPVAFQVGAGLAMLIESLAP